MTSENKYQLWRFWIIFVTVFSVICLYGTQKEWIDYLLHTKDTQIVEAQIIGEGKGGIRPKVNYIRLEYLMNGERFETKLWSAMNEHVGDRILIGIKSNSKVVRVKPIIPQIRLWCYYLVWALNIFLLVNYCKVRKQYIQMRREKLKEWERKENWD